MSRYRFIEAEKRQHAICLLCRVLEVSRAAYYRWKSHPVSDRALHNLVLLAKIRKAHTDSDGAYGSPRIYAELQDQGVQGSRGRIARLMAVSGIVGARARRRIRTTIPARKPAPFPDLVKRRFEAAGPNEIWCGDLTYVHTTQGFLYAATVIDVFSRRVIGWAMAPLTCALPSSRTPCAWLLPTGAGRSRELSSTRIAAPNTEPASSRTLQALQACVSPWGAWLIASITRWPSRSSPRSSANSSTGARGKHGRRPDTRSSIGSRPSTIGSVATALSECWPPWPTNSNTRYSAMQPNDAVYQIGATPFQPGGVIGESPEGKIVQSRGLGRANGIFHCGPGALDLLETSLARSARGSASRLGLCRCSFPPPRISVCLLVRRSSSSRYTVEW
jgi:transposase InsO family protein